MAFSPKNSPGGGYFVTGLTDQNGRSRAEYRAARFQPPADADSGIERRFGAVYIAGRTLARISLTGVGQVELYLRSISGLGGRHPISVGGATEPAWNPRGGELFYRVGPRLIAATLEFAPEPRVVRRDTLAFVVNTQPNADGASYGVSADGRRFVMARPVGGK